MKVSYDLFNSGFKEGLRDLGGLTTHAILGYVESWCSPLTLKRISHDFEVEGQRDKISIYNLANLGVETLIYVASMGHHIEDLLRDPADVKNWIPVATNIVGRTIGYVYDHHREIADSFKEEELHVPRASVSETQKDSEIKSGESRYYD